ncbi:gamma-glutamylcyclotransferase [Paracoccus sp. (in: a-proteobacteria)]|uniref:gamma-glutamylcyclotransferase n=1 Tax=Paracoccus sp. TaxID=267 RepID=UPI00272ABC81|nr:gamma-glutamylcyclotransferase [Paracoccus sp. (in: a-proteobacteria)]
MHKIDWIFGYGSLIWDPGFRPVEAVRASLNGYRRSFCLRSIQHRGTAARPGLVLGLDQDEGACCTGLAMRIAPADHDEVLAYLRARELVTDAYREAVLPLTLEDGRHVEALTYVMRRDHWQYAGSLPPEEQARTIAGAVGGRGPNADYLFNTAEHLARIGLGDPQLDHLADRVRKLLENRASKP